MDGSAVPGSAKPWVCVFNRNRDNYQVPLALYQAGVLETLVTDFYAPENAPPWLPQGLRGFRHDDLPASHTTSSPVPFVLQAAAHVLKLPMRHVFPHTDHILALRAAKYARARHANLYCYGNYVPPREACGPDTRIIDFEFHPHAALTFDLLRRDAELYPQVAASFASEADDLKRERVIDAWRAADAIVCASNMTRKSLEFAGCASERITVIPYGCAPPHGPGAPRPAGPCRLLFVGQGIQRKGLHHLLLAWRQIAHLDAELTLVCYHIDPGIAQLAETSGVRLLGRQDRAALDALFAASDVFVMPSIVEGFGLTYLEALAAGCHVVGTENTGLPDLPFDAEAMSIVPVGDIDALAQRLEQLIARKQEGGLSPGAIAAQTGRWQWRDFRRAIADHAGVIGQQ